MQMMAVVGKQPSEVGPHDDVRPELANPTDSHFVVLSACRAVAAQQRRREVSMDFDPRSIDDSRDRDVYGRELNQGSRGGLSNPRERERLDPRDLFTRDLELP